MQELKNESAVYAEIINVFEKLRDRLITMENKSTWKNTQGLHAAVYSAVGILLSHESILLERIRRKYPGYLQNREKDREWLETKYNREETRSGCTRLTLPRAKNYIIDITDACSDIIGMASGYYSQGKDFENSGRELCKVVNQLTGVKLSGFKDAGTLDPLIMKMLRKARTPAKEFLLFGYKPDVLPKEDAADDVQEDDAVPPIEEIKTPEIKKNTHGGKRAGAGRHKNAVQTVRITFKLTPEHAEEVKKFVDELRNRH